MLTRRGACGALVLGVALAAPRAGAQESGERPRVTAGGLVEVRGAHVRGAPGWLDSGLGKLRYGEIDGHASTLATLPQASLLLDVRFSEVLSAHVQVNLDGERDRAGTLATAGLVEAFVGWRPEPSPSLRVRARLGLFFPPVSLEHPNPAWSTEHTITPSAINTWVGEEVRSTGAELELAWKGADSEVAATGAVFGNNDPSGTLLAWRGFALHDRQTVSGDRLPLAPITAIRAPSPFSRQAPWDAPIREMDGRLGWYAGGSVRVAGVTFRGLYWDNRADPAYFDGFQYGWRTQFASVALRARAGSHLELLAQYLGGRTRMGSVLGATTAVDAGFTAAYGLAAVSAGRHRVAVRYDWFEVQDDDTFGLLDPNEEDGDAWTAAYTLKTGAHHRLAAEYLRVKSDRPARTGIGRPVRETEALYQVSFRFTF